MLPSSALALAFVLTAAPAGPGEHEASKVQSPHPEAAPSPEEARGAAAKLLYSQQRYVESARAYEELHGEYGDPKYLFNAAAAHEGAGQDAHAYVALRRFLNDPGLSAEGLARGEARLTPLRRRTTPIQLEIVPSPRPMGLVLELRRPGIEPVRLDADALAALDRRGLIELRAEPGEWLVEAQAPGFHKLQLPLTTSAEGGRALLTMEPVATAVAPGPALVAVTATFEPAQAVAAGIDVKLEGPKPQSKRVQSSPVNWELSPGNWTLDASSPGYRPARVFFVAGDQTIPPNIRLEPAPRGRPTVIALSALAGTSFVAGAIVSVRNAITFRSRLQPGTEPSTVEHQWRGFHHGTRLLGAGLGLGVGALLKSFEFRMKHPKRAWITALITGTGLAALGFGLYKIPADAYQIAFPSCTNIPPGECDDVLVPLHEAGATDFVGGLGVGLVTAGAVGLVQLALKGRRKPQHLPKMRASTRGLMLSF